MTAAYSPAVVDRRIAPFVETPVGFVVPGKQHFVSSCPRSLPAATASCTYTDHRYPAFGEPPISGGSGAMMDAGRSPSYSEYRPDLDTNMGPSSGAGSKQSEVGVRYPSVGEPLLAGGSGVMMNAGRQPSYDEYVHDRSALNTDVGPSGGTGGRQPENGFEDRTEGLPSPYDSTGAPASRRLTPSPYARDSFRQSKDDSGIFTDVRSAAATPIDSPSDSSGTPGRQQFAKDNDSNARPQSASMPRHPSISPASGGNVRPDSQQYGPIVPASASPSYRPISISPNTRAVAQQPTYITPPSSPTPIAVNPIYTYNPTAQYAPEPVRPAPIRAPAGVYAQQPYRTAQFNAPDGREVCVECAMRDQDMADVDVTGPGVWERESDVYYHDLCRRELEETEERAHARTSNSSSESQVVVRATADPNRPRARGNRLTEPNLKLWLSMNPREPQARQQTIDLYIKTQTALLEAEALARARAMQESRLLESKLRDTYDSLRRSTYDATPSTLAGDDGIARLKASHASRRSISGPAPLSLGPLNIEGAPQHVRHQNQSREVTLLENGMIVEHVDVRKEEKERRREERRERERERSRARKSSRGSGGNGAEAMSMYSAHSPLPHQTDSGFYTAASSGIGSGTVGVLPREHDRPKSASQTSMRPMSVLTTPTPLTPPGSGLSSARPPSGRVQSQVSLLDSQSLSSASMSANRRSRFFAFRNWSEAWKSRESFAPSAVMSTSGSMMDMHVALDREKQSMQMRPKTVDLGSNAPSLRASGQWPRRASLSVDCPVQPSDSDNRPKAKKKRGLAKIWCLVTGSHKNAKEGDAQRGNGREVQSTERSEDEPLAPPPPLSYLVNRTTPRERSMSAASRRTSIPPAAVAPPPSTALPTPTSIRNTWLEPSNHVLPAHAEEVYSNGNGYLGSDLEPPRGIHSALSEPDIRQRVQEQQQPPQHMRAPSSPRPISVYSLHKSLPPLPNEIPSSPVDAPRPKTMYDVSMSPQDDREPQTLETPQPFFRRDVRRQSFGGMSSRPDAPATFPLDSGRAGARSALAMQDAYAYAQVPPPSPSPYAEMGVAAPSRSLGRLGYGSGDEGADKALGKRRSRFGLASLLGKMTGAAGRNSQSSGGSGGDASARLSGVGAAPPAMANRDAETMLPSSSESHVDGSPGATAEYGAGGGSSRSRHTGLAVTGGGPASRMSVASRRAIEELVDQDPNFVAYRYPSVEQNIALLR
ncbi:hypothetical protein DFH11DRAFT_1723091 [Phellopilus nigrolimitatus]|nr:hypothetical protein DFH11DRAFT_1723091 [Phellopilus nigrolimitatus]